MKETFIGKGNDFIGKSTEEGRVILTAEKDKTIKIKVIPGLLWAESSLPCVSFIVPWKKWIFRHSCLCQSQLCLMKYFLYFRLLLLLV